MNRDTCLQLTGVRINNRSPASNGRALPEQDKPRSASRLGPGGQPKAETHRQVPAPSAPENLTCLPSLDSTRCIPEATELAGSRVSGTQPSQPPRSSAMPSPSDRETDCRRSESACFQPVAHVAMDGLGKPVLPLSNKRRFSRDGTHCLEPAPPAPRQLAVIPRRAWPTLPHPNLSELPNGCGRKFSKPPQPKGAKSHDTGSPDDR